jgi:Kef-type K+ transport system membrane component KefB
MIETSGDLSHLVLLTGAVIVLTMLVKGILEKSVFPPLVGFMALGFCLRWFHESWPVFSQGGHEVISFVAKLGLVTLLFRVGMGSDITNLVRQLKNASVAWVANIAVAGLAGYLTTVMLLGYGTISGLIVGAALTATSVGVSVKVWEDRKALQSANGALLVDLAELDDVTAVVIMALVFTVVPLLHAGGATDILTTLLTTTLWFLVKMVLFGALCFVFAVFLERPMTKLLARVESRPDSTLTIVGIGFVIAALAASLGFSLAIGAFFAGLVFSRDPQCLSLEESFVPIFDFFSPFFFVGIGYEFQAGTMGSALGMGLLLTAVAMATKVLANGIPLSLVMGVQSGALIGMSMVPRAEIALVIMQKGMNLGDWAVDQKLFGSMVVVSALTCLVAPVLVRTFLARWPQGEKDAA